MRRYVSPEIKAKIVRLRREDRLGSPAIALRCGVSRATVAKLVADDPLTGAEVTQKQRFGNGNKKGRAIREVTLSHLFDKFGQRQYTNNEKGRIAETAVLLRLHLLQYEVYGSTYGGDRIDWIVLVGSRLVKVQVRWACWGSYGAPSVSLTKSNGRHGNQKFSPEDLDILVGYDAVTDTAYVYRFEEIKDNRRVLSMRDEAAEQWGKLLL